MSKMILPFKNKLLHIFQNNSLLILPSLTFNASNLNPSAMSSYNVHRIETVKTRALINDYVTRNYLW
jgi:hypothetical protein